MDGSTGETTHLANVPRDSQVRKFTQITNSLRNWKHTTQAETTFRGRVLSTDGEDNPLQRRRRILTRRDTMTTRQRIDTGGWFDLEAATSFKEATVWNGNNHISVPTGSQWEHQYLYYTKSGNWVLNCWSQYQNSIETYEQIDEDSAIEWLIENEYFHDHPQLERLPNKVRDRLQEGIEAREV
jgi:hypothetical protein